jgi:hypothetical protein
MRSTPLHHIVTPLWLISPFRRSFLITSSGTNSLCSFLNAGTEAGSGIFHLAGAMGAVTYPQSRSGLGKSPQTIPHLSNGQ